MNSLVKGIKAVGNRIIVKRDSKDTQSKGGIIVIDGSTEEKFTGVIVAIGTGQKTNMGVLIPFDFKVGDNVLLARHAFKRNDQVHVKGDDGEYFRVGENDILAVIEG